MKGSFGFLALCVLCAVASADRVALKNGVVVTGKARVYGNAVCVENDTGVLTLPLWRVERVSISDGKPEAPQGMVEQAAGPDAQRAGGPGGKQGASEDLAARLSSALTVLEKRIDVHLDGVPLADTISYLQEITGANFSYRLSDLEADPTSVTLSLRNVTLRQVLKALLEERGLAWRVHENIIRIRPAGELWPTTVRVYDVRDLLIDSSDIEAVRTPTAGERSDRSRRKDGSYGQWGRDDSRSYDRRDRDEERRRRTARERTASERTYDLALLITLVVCPESWAEPPVIGVGWVVATSEREEDGSGGRRTRSD